MAILDYKIDFGSGWLTVTDLVKAGSASVLRNACSNGFKSVADTASLTLIYNGKRKYVDVANAVLSAQQEGRDVSLRVSLEGGEILFEGKLNLSKLSITSSKIPTDMMLSATDYSTELDAQPKVNRVFDRRTVEDIIESLLSMAVEEDKRKIIARWQDESLKTVVPDVPMVLTTDDGVTYRERIDTLLQETGSAVLYLDPADGLYKVRKISSSSSTTDIPAVTYRTNDTLATDRGLWDNDGIVVKYPTVVRADTKTLIYTYMPSLTQNNDETFVRGDVIPVGGYWPQDGDLSPVYQDFETRYVDKAYNTNKARTQNSDLDLYYVDPGEEETPDIDITLVTSDLTGEKLDDWYDMDGLPDIGKGKGIDLYPRKAWILLHNKSGKEVNLIHAELRGKPVYRSRVNNLIAPVDAENPFEYECSYIASSDKVRSFASFLFNMKTNSTSTSRWTGRWEDHELGSLVKIQHKGWKDNPMGYTLGIVASKTSKVLGNELWAEYVSVSVSGWTTLPQLEEETSLPSTAFMDSYQQWLAEGNTGTRKDFSVSQTTIVQYAVIPSSSTFGLGVAYGFGEDPDTYGFAADSAYGADYTWEAEQADPTTLSPGEFIWMRTSTDGGKNWRYTRLVGADVQIFQLIAESMTYKVNKRSVGDNPGIRVYTKTAGYKGTATVACTTDPSYLSEEGILTIPYNTPYTDGITVAAYLEGAETQILKLRPVDETAYNAYLGRDPSGTKIDGDSYFDEDIGLLKVWKDGEWLPLNRSGLDAASISRICAQAQQDVLSTIDPNTITASDYGYFKTIITQLLITMTIVSMNYVEREAGYKLEGSTGSFEAVDALLSGSISVDHAFVAKGVFRTDRFYPEWF